LLRFIWGKILSPRNSEVKDMGQILFSIITEQVAKGRILFFYCFYNISNSYGTDDEAPSFFKWEFKYSYIVKYSVYLNTVEYLWFA